MAMAGAIPYADGAVLDFDPRGADAPAAGRARSLLVRALQGAGPAALAEALRVPAADTARLKHLVACVTCRSRLDALSATLVERSRRPAAGKADADQASVALANNGAAPLSAWLAADEAGCLTPAPEVLRDPDALSSFLAAFGDDVVSEPSRRGGRLGRTERCQHHALDRLAPVALPPHTATLECERLLGLLRHGTTEAEWNQLATVDAEALLSDLFTWLQDRGHRPRCVDFVTAAWLGLRDAVIGCEAQAPAILEDTVLTRPPELLRVGGCLRHLCGIYRLQALYVSGRPTYKKERSEVYILFTTRKDWMFSGRADAGGARCEGFAYAADDAEAPDQVRACWAVSAPHGWNDDATLCVRAFEATPEGYDIGPSRGDGAPVVLGQLAKSSRASLVLPLRETPLLHEVLWGRAPWAPGAGEHALTAKMAALELEAWLRQVLRERILAQRRRVLAQAQISASLCRLFACAAMQRLEAAAETVPAAASAASAPAPHERGRRAGRKSKSEARLCREAVGAGELEVGTRTGADWAKGLDRPDVAAAAAVDAAGVAYCEAPAGESDGSSSTRASSEEATDMHRDAASTARRLMLQMGWLPEAERAALLGVKEVAAWRKQHPRYQQDVRDGRQRLQARFHRWVVSTAS